MPTDRESTSFSQNIKDLREQIRELNDTTSVLTLDVATKAGRIGQQNCNLPLTDADTEEIHLGGLVNEDIGSLFHRTLPALKVADEYSLDYFISKFKEILDEGGWSASLSCFDFLRAPVSFQALNRKIPPRVIPLENKEKRRKVRTQDDQALQQASQPQMVSSENQGNFQCNYVEHVLTTLKKAFKEVGGPISFWLFILNPCSFELTVENMFSVNILVNDGKVKLVKGKKEEYFLRPILSKSKEKGVQGSKKQIFISLETEEYSKLLKEFNIRSPMIDPLSDSDSD